MTGWEAGKGLGALAGAVLSLAIWRPRSFVDGGVRLLVSGVSAFVFGPVVTTLALERFPAVDPHEMTLAAWAVVGAFSWPVMGALYRIIDKYQGPK